jgi:tetratricopeptide (TPR) repeat protein
LTAEEANLLHARQLARRHGWWQRVISTMQGLRSLYGHTGRRAEWKRLVEDIVPDFVDPASDGPLPGREEQWHFAAQYRTVLALEARQWAEAERLQSVQVNWFRSRTASALAIPPEALDGAERNAIRNLAVSLELLGHIQREQGKPVCVTTYEEVVPLYQRFGDQPAEAATAFNLGHAYNDLPALRDLDQAERWYRRSLELLDEQDLLGRSKAIDQIGIVWALRFQEGRRAGASDDQLLEYANEAVRAFQQALKWAPPDAADKLGLSHQHLGNIYNEIGHLDHALPHYREAIRCFEAGGNLYEAARTRQNIALGLIQAGRLADAREYATAALRNYQTYGDRAAAEIQETQGLIAEIEQAIAET